MMRGGRRNHPCALQGLCDCAAHLRNRQICRRRPRFYAQFVEDMFQVLVHRAWAGAEDVADVFVGFA